jgi:hypothetical protein
VTHRRADRFLAGRAARPCEVRQAPRARSRFQHGARWEWSWDGASALGCSGSFATAFIGPYRTHKTRHAADALRSSEGAVLQPAALAVKPLPQPTVFIREEPSLIYTASCPVHESTDDPDRAVCRSRGTWIPAWRIACVQLGRAFGKTHCGARSSQVLP